MRQSRGVHRKKMKNLSKIMWSLLQELNLYEDDITFEINTVLDRIFHRKAKNTSVFGENGEKKWSVGLQQIGTTI